MHGCMDAWMHACMDSCMDACIHACIHTQQCVQSGRNVRTTPCFRQKVWAFFLCRSEYAVLSFSVVQSVPFSPFLLCFEEWSSLRVLDWKVLPFSPFPSWFVDFRVCCSLYPFSCQQLACIHVYIYVYLFPMFFKLISSGCSIAFGGLVF